MTTNLASDPRRHGSLPQPDRSDRAEVLASSGISVRLWRLYAQAWLVCLFFPVAALLEVPLPSDRLILAVSGLVVYGGVYSWLMWPHPVDRETRAGSPRSIIMFTALTALVLWLSLAYGSPFLWLFVGLSATAGVALSARSGFVVTMGLTLLTLGLGVWIGGGVDHVDWLHLVPLVLLVRGLGLDLTGMARLSDALRDLQAARGAAARQAVTDERLRLARDLHDLLGHTLSLIALKTELARRLVERAPAQATQEIQEVERIARQALRDVREAVAGYRQPTLQSELEAAREILNAAGIDPQIEQQIGGPVPPTIETALAWAVREGVTNVIRHSRAHLCVIRLTGADGHLRVEVINDGPTTQASHTPQGHGLDGLAERVAGLGGRVAAGPLAVDGTERFRLLVEIPIAASDRYEQEQHT